MSFILFSQAYEIRTQQYGQLNYNKSQRVIHQVDKKRMPNENKGDPTISVHFNDQELKNNDKNFLLLSKLKYIGVLQPIDQYTENNETILIYQDYLAYGLDEEKFNNIVMEQQGYKMLLQLALMFAEFERRNIKWPLDRLEEIYYIDGLFLLCLSDYNFTSSQLKQSQFEVFQTFYNYYFRFYYRDVEDFFPQKSFKLIIDFLLEKENIHQDPFSEPYEATLNYLLNIEKFNTLYKRGNICAVKEFKVPQVLKRIFPKLRDEENIVYKLKQAYGDDEDGALSNNIKREIELMEEFNDLQATASCFTYFRIENLPYLLQKKYVGTLSDALEAWKPIEQQLKKDVYTFSQRFAAALVELHKKKILHRDLKPENLFMDSKSLTLSWVYIADFDRSKQLAGQQNMNITQENAANTRKYDPPEQDIQTFTYDIFQYGLIVLTIANKGQYVGLPKGPRSMDKYEFDSFYSYQSIQQRIGRFGYEDDFIKLIHSCLQSNPAERPDAEQVYGIVNKLNFRSKIRLLSLSKMEQIQN